MARARLIKPGFFTNDRLGALPPVTRILFAGLWTIADREGRLEDRPVRIKAEVMPYDKGNVDRMLTDLAEAGFIIRYEANGQRYIQVDAFSKHQHPHVREPVSTIPPPFTTPGEHSASTSLAPVKHSKSPAVTDPVTISGSGSAPDGRSALAPAARDFLGTVLLRIGDNKTRRDPSIEAELVAILQAHPLDVVEAALKASDEAGDGPWPGAIRKHIRAAKVASEPRRESLNGDLPSADELFPNAPWNRKQVAK